MAYIVNELILTCFACPAQWKGTTADQRQIYIKYRWGYLSVRVSQPNDTAEFAAVNGEEILEEEVGDGLDGWMEEAEMMERTKGVLDWSQITARSRSGSVRVAEEET